MNGFREGLLVGLRLSPLFEHHITMERFCAETAQAAGAALVHARSPRRIPNNLGPTLLIATGLLAIPLIIGFPLLLIGLARLKTVHGTLEFPRLATLHHHWLGWLIR